MATPMRMFHERLHDLHRPRPRASGPDGRPHHRPHNRAGDRADHRADDRPGSRPDNRPGRRSPAERIREGLRFVLLLAAALLSLGARAAATTSMPADMGWLLDRIRAAGDNQGAPFMVLDKRKARLWVLDAGGRVVGAAPVLLGYAAGDHTVPDIGSRPLEKVRPHEKTTPAGRFALEPGRNLRGEKVLWLDYDSGLSMHKVITGQPAEHRLQRLATPTAADNRISFGCINVPTAFYEQVVMPSFGLMQRGRAFIYVLPETRPLASVFRL